MARSPLVAAALDGSIEEVRALLDGGADPNALCRETQWSPLHAANRLQYWPEIVRLLVEAGPDPNDDAA